MNQTRSLTRCEGVILQAFPYGDFDQILVAFSKEKGLVKFIVKGANREKKRGQAQTSPLAQVEFVYSTGQSELWPCKEITVKNMHLDLRKSLETLEAGCAIAHTLLASQMVHKPSPRLYDLCTAYLSHLAKAPFPEALAASFILKVLRHDGLFHETPRCTTCHGHLKSASFVGHDPYCNEHAPPIALTFDETEWNLISTLAFCRTYSDLHTCSLSDLLRKKIDRLFDEHLNH